MSGDVIDIKSRWRTLFDSGVVNHGRLQLVHFDDGGLAVELNRVRDDGFVDIRLVFGLNRREAVALRDALDMATARGPLLDGGGGEGPQGP